MLFDFGHSLTNDVVGEDVAEVFVALALGVTVTNTVGEPELLIIRRRCQDRNLYTSIYAPSEIGLDVCELSLFIV